MRTEAPRRSLSRWLRPAWTDQPEWMDEAAANHVALAGNLRDLARVNRWLGGVRLSLHGVALLTGELPPGASLRLLDVATGAADIPRALHAWALRQGYQPYVIASDLSEPILRVATGSLKTSTPRSIGEDLALVAADGRALPFADRSVDIAHCSLALHHLAPPDALLMLREMGRVSRHGVVVNDLIRSWTGLAGAAMFGHLCTRNAFTRHDAPLSVRRAYTPQELRSLVLRAGLRPIHQESVLGYRIAITAVPAEPGSPS